VTSEPRPTPGRWVDEPVLPELPTGPPPHLIRVEGARLIRVMNVDAHNPASRDGYTEAVVLATAPLGGGTGVLVAWLGGWQEGHRATGRGRYAWCRLLEDRVREVAPPRAKIDGAEWHGHHAEGEFAGAVRQAAELLPEEMRAAALTPRPVDGSA